MTALPLPISVVLVTLTAAVVLGRWWLVDDQLIDRLLNWALTWEALGLTCFVCLAGISGPELAEYLFLACGPMTIVNLYGMARLLDGADPAAAARRQRRYNRFGAAAALLIAFGAVTGRTELAEWVWAVCNSVTIAAGPLVIRACVRELRSGTTRRERWAYSALLVVSAYLAVGSAVVAVRAVMGLPTAVPGTVYAIISYLVLVLLCLLIAIPLLLALVKRAGWDRDSRRYRRLHALWRDLTAAVPEVVLAQGVSYTGDPTLRLYRTTVEIRDALLQLKLYTEDTSNPGTGIHHYALRIAEAVQAKSRGLPAPGSADPVALAAPADRTAELRALLDLAAAWPAAKAAISGPPTGARTGAMWVT
ncbi:MAB_1171c family putative transporter [Nocardia sp. XZ_19_385]|uniref:MAB_1171c family putative transporter n=1 Tax=Nocardia sp. XZ_19_385 TaxID=2769488 RepID=UPI001890AF95|nr:MAB_1171c family putative transporter [Nocardia sp. XZ_19_385]